MMTLLVVLGDNIFYRYGFSGFEEAVARPQVPRCLVIMWSILSDLV